MKNTVIKNSKTLPVNLHFVLIGIMLGDGFIYRSSLTSNSRFEMSFGSNYKQFAESIGELFKDYLITPVKTIKIKGKDKIYINYRTLNNIIIKNRYILPLIINLRDKLFKVRWFIILNIPGEYNFI